MNPEDRARAQRLCAVLATHERPAPERSALIEDAATMAHFRTRLLVEGHVGSDGQEVADHWRREIQRKIEQPDSNELMLALQKLMARLRAIDVELALLDAVLLRELQVLDESCGRLASLRDKLLHSQRSIEQCRLSMIRNFAALAAES